MTEYTWHLKAEVLPEYDVYQNVIDKVYWTCIAEENDERAQVSGVEPLPRPVSPETFVDLSAIMAMDAATKKATILAWAEVLHPGFVANNEAAASAALTARSVTAPRIIEVQ